MATEKTALLKAPADDRAMALESAIDDATGEGDLKKLEMQHLLQTKDSWTWYRLACQFRFAYMSFLVLMVIVMFSFSTLMEVFFSVFLPSAQAAPGFVVRCIVFLGILPFLIILLSSEGSLPNFRLSVAVVLHYLRHHKEMPEDDVGRAITYDPYKDDKPETAESNTDAETKTTHHVMHPKYRWKLAIRRVIARRKAAIVFGTTSYDGPPIDYSTFVIVDLICPVVFEVATLAGFISELVATQSINEAFYRYLRVGFFTMGFYLALWMACHWFSSRNSRMRELVANYHRTRRALEKKISIIVHEETFKSFWLLDLGFRVSHTVQRSIARAPAWCCGCFQSKTTLPHDAHVSMEPSAFERWHKPHTDMCLNPWKRLSLNGRLLALFPAVVLSAYLSLLSFYVGWPLMGFFLVVGATTIQQRFPQVFGDAFRHFVTAFILVSFVFFTSSFVVGTFVTGGNFNVRPPHANQVVDVPRVEMWGQIPRYAVCNLNQSGLGIVDFILLADAAYGRNTSLQQQMLHERFDGTGLRHWNFTDASDPVLDHQKWFQVDFVDINTTVVAIRGTASAADALEDMHYWFGITIMQAANVFIPFLTQLPQDFVVQLLSMNVLEKITPPPVYTNLVKKVSDLRAAGKRVVLTGHSLGGAMAAMVGAKTHTPAISFSGPGLAYTRGRFHLDEADIRDYVMTIKPVSDIVPRVDVLGGMVQDIECRKTNPLACHGSSTHACELYMACGDKRHRDWSQATQCADYIETKPQSTPSTEL
ncbi:hypothetical protein, variant [Aphanomyces invadans]|uniref:Fungal lipase-type domain-containing protein n=1 Tax=Aphanomyces invadans TaxID=157072 RepID=A0A024TA43_9STRA|nr:hypothetical protein, variant [Aphanomyces invadans]ETV90888.1 hypothetical protein, variant [Aphanomyces invadans]|eukprot:XP_008880453.1 hypothetical protein, variant [Aphanomyces invadans]